VWKQWHFHVYFFQNNEQSVADAKRIQNDLIDYVKREEAVFVLNGVTSDILPGLNDSTVPEFNMEPIGPHACGSFEVCAVSCMCIAYVSLKHVDYVSALLCPQVRNILGFKNFRT
jgi:hypothetical protein